MTSLHFSHALLPAGWAKDVRVAIDGDGRISRVVDNVAPAEGDQVFAGKALAAAPGNVHSHAFQRAMAGRAEFRSADVDSFWTWRETMYDYAAALTPEALEAIAAYAFMEMAEAGYGAVAEFHYLHHRPDGGAYANIAEMSSRVMAAAASVGLGLTLLPVFYGYGGARGAPLAPRQRRFGSTIESYGILRAAVDREAKYRLADFRVGAALHSLRAASPDAVRAIAADFAGDVIHIHAAEQNKEVEDIKAWLGARPVEWLLDNAPLGPTWCLVHATHMTEAETEALARSGATAGLCPVTEANLGDGVFNGEVYCDAGGRIGIGTDSNIKISLAEELRLLEYSQRLALRKRNVFCRNGRSTGRTLLEAALAGGANALGRPSGRIEEGLYADFFALDGRDVAFAGAAGDGLLDAFIFAGGEGAVCDVWSAGRHIVRDGRHVRREAIEARFRETMAEFGG